MTIFKFWKWRFELKLSRVPEHEKVDFLIKELFETMDKQYDLRVCTNKFKGIELQMHTDGEVTYGGTLTKFKARTITGVNASNRA